MGKNMAMGQMLSCIARRWHEVILAMLLGVILVFGAFVYCLLANVYKSHPSLAMPSPHSMLTVAKNAGLGVVLSALQIAPSGFDGAESGGASHLLDGSEAMRDSVHLDEEDSLTTPVAPTVGEHIDLKQQPEDNKDSRISAP